MTTLSAKAKASLARSAIERATVYGDAAYGTGEPPVPLEDANIASKCKTQPPVAKNGLFTKDRFLVDLGTDTVTCPNDVTVKIRRLKDGDGIAKFATHCVTCPLAWQCTTSRIGRKIPSGSTKPSLPVHASSRRTRNGEPTTERTRPKVERKLGHLMRRRHGGRRGECAETSRVAADFVFSLPQPTLHASPSSRFVRSKAEDG